MADQLGPFAASGNLIDPITFVRLGRGVIGYLDLRANGNAFEKQDLRSNGSNIGTTVNGILVSAGTTVTLSNNLIGNLTSSTATGSNAIIGININTSATATSTVKVYCDTVYLNNSPSASGFGSSGIFHNSSGYRPTVDCA